MATYAITIGGVSKTLQDGWTINEPANAIGTLRAEVFSSTGAYIPALDADVVITENGTRIFGGVIDHVAISGALEGPTTPIVSDITAQSYAILAQRRYVNQTIPSGTLKAALTALVASLDGVTLDAGQVDGPTLGEIVFQVWTVANALDYLTTLTGYVWEISYSKVLSMYTPGTRTAPFAVTLASKAAIDDVRVEPVRDRYANIVTVYGTGFKSVAQDAGEITAHGTWELPVQSPDTTTQSGVDALSAAILAASIPTAKRVTYRTKQLGLIAGQTQTITISARNVNNTFIITEVMTRAVSPTRVEREVSALEGIVYQTGWRETIKGWSGSGSGALTFPGVGATTNQRFAYFLGGSGIDFVRSATPTWVDASPIAAQINTVARGTTAATVSGRLRAAESGVSVQARLYDLTASAPVSGTSAVVTSTSWTIISFSVVLTAGSHYYVLQVLPGAADSDVAAVAYIE